MNTATNDIMNHIINTDFSDPRVVINLVLKNKKDNDDIIEHTDDMVEFALAVDRRHIIDREIKKVTDMLEADGHFFRAITQSAKGL